MTEEKKELTASELASMGGKAIKEKYGSKHFSKLAKRRHKKRRQQQ